MIVLIGVGHVFEIQENLKVEIVNAKPDVVCVELDAQRAQALLDAERRRRSEKSTARERTEVPLIYNALAMIQQNLASKFDTTPGMEMLCAINVAKEANARIEFIDVDAVTIASRIWREMSFVERAKFIASLFFGFFVTRSSVQKSIDEFMNDEERVIQELSREFPTIKRILIDERNEYMAWRIIQTALEHERVVCVLGDGHIHGVSGILSQHGVSHQIIRLRQLLSKTNSEYTFTWAW
jgi:pheromone shutdown protein TraB